MISVVLSYLIFLANPTATNTYHNCIHHIFHRKRSQSRHILQLRAHPLSYSYSSSSSSSLSSSSSSSLSSFILPNTSIVLLGGLGHLATHKLIPALFSLHRKNLLPDDFTIVGCSRADESTQSYRESLLPILTGLKYHQESTLDRDNQFQITFLDRVHFHPLINYSSSSCFSYLDSSLLSSSINKIIYLALPPHQFNGAIDAITSINMKQTQLIIEKPIGRDLASSQILLNKLRINAYIKSILVDHYLCKPAIADIIQLRQTHAFIEESLNKDHVSHVVIEFREIDTVDGRGGYFDSYGIIRDVLQNHLLQALSLLLMDLPSSAENEKELKRLKLKLLRSILPASISSTVIGQYEGYRAGEGVRVNSSTPTYAACMLTIDSDRWRNVSILMVAGKALSSSGTTITVKYKAKATPEVWGQRRFDSLIIRVQPEPAYIMRRVRSEGALEDDLLHAYPKSLPDAYETLLHRLLLNADSSCHFASDDEVVASWAVFEPLLSQETEKGGTDGWSVESYACGSEGPAGALTLLSRISLSE